MKLLKKILIVFIILIILGIVGIFIFLKTFDIDRFKPQIISGISTAIGRTVDFDDIDLQVSIKKGVHLTMGNLVVHGDVDFQSGDFLTVENISLGVEIMPFLANRRILVSSVHILSPHCVIVRTKDGRINVQNLGKSDSIKKDSGEALSSNDVQGIKSTKVSQAARSVPFIFAETIEVENGKVTYVDRALESKDSLEVSRVHLKIDGFSLTKPFSFQIDSAVLGEQENVHMKGQLRINIQNNQVSLKNIQIETDLSLLSLKKIRSHLPLPEETPFPNVLKGTIKANAKEIVLSPEGMTSITVDAQWLDGELSFLELAPGISLNVSQIGLSLTNFSLKEPFSFDLQAAYLSDQPNIDLKGTAVINSETPSITLNNTKVATALSSLSLSKLQSSLAMLKDVDLPQQMRGDFSATIEQMEIGTKGLVTLKSSVELRQGFIKHKLLSSPIEPMQLSSHITESNIDIAELLLGFGKGSLTVKGKLDDYTGGQDFNFNIHIQDLNLEEILNQDRQPVKLQGFLEGQFKAQGKGLSMDRLRDALLGEGSLKIKEGRLKDINVLQIVLDKMSMIPNLAARVEASLPERYKEILTQKDTILTKAKTDASVQDGVVLLNPIEIEADGFLFLGSGNINFDQRFSLEGTFFIPEDLAASMVEIVSELQYLLDKKGNIRIPLNVSGKAPDIKFAVDLEYIGKKMLESKASDELNKILDKWLGKSPPPPETDNSDTTDVPQDREKSLERELIENIFDAIFQ